MADREVLRRPASGPEPDAPHSARAAGPATPRWAERVARSPDCGADCGCDHCGAQPKAVTVSSPGDADEREADHVSRRVLDQGCHRLP